MSEESTEISNPKFKAIVDAKLDEFVARFYERDPVARKQVESSDLNKEYYQRQVIETVLRIRLRRVIDALVVHHFTKTNPRLAKTWARYTDEEMLHDTLYAMDLKKMGVPHEKIYGTEPFFSTKLLQGYLYYTLENEGPLGTLCYSYSVEYTSRKTQPAWLDNLEKIVGKDKIHGARTHLNYDINEDHSHVVWNVLASQAQTPEKEASALAHINNFFGLLVGFSHELYAATMLPKPAAPDEVVVAAVRAATAPAGQPQR